MDSDEVVAIRRRRLRKAAELWFGGNEAALARAVQRAGSQVSDMIAGRKSFGEKVARAIEENLRKFLAELPDDEQFALPPCWLDLQEGMSISSEGDVNCPAPTTKVAPFAPPGKEACPLPKRIHAALKGAPERLLGRVEQAILDVIKEWEQTEGDPGKKRAAGAAGRGHRSKRVPRGSAR